jgi:hypothetical protein
VLSDSDRIDVWRERLRCVNGRRGCVHCRLRLLVVSVADNRRLRLLPLVTKITLRVRTWCARWSNGQQGHERPASSSYRPTIARTYLVVIALCFAFICLQTGRWFSCRSSCRRQSGPPPLQRRVPCRDARWRRSPTFSFASAKTAKNVVPDRSDRNRRENECRSSLG